MPSPLRVVHLVNNFPPEFMGGTERYVSQLATLQKDAGLDVAVVAGSEHRDDAIAGRDEVWQGVPVRRVFRRTSEAYGVEFLPQQATAALLEAVRERAPDLVHLHHWFNLGDELLAALSRAPADARPGAPRPRAIVSLHDFYSACPRFFFLRPDGFFCGSDLPVPIDRCVECIRPEDGFAGLEERIAARRARFARELEQVACALAPSDHHAELLVRAGVVARSKLRVLPLGLARVPARAPHVPKPGRLRLVSFGNLSRVKGTDLIFDALRGLPADKLARIGLHLFGAPLAGDAELLRAASAGLPVTWHGEYDLDRLAAAAPALDLALFPSRAHESFSLVVEEAIALGLPLIVSDRGAPPRRIASNAAGAAAEGGRAFGRAVAVEDASALRATLSELMDHPERLDALRRALPDQPHRLADHERTLRELYAAVAGR